MDARKKTWIVVGAGIVVVAAIVLLASDFFLVPEGVGWQVGKYSGSETEGFERLTPPGDFNLDYKTNLEPGHSAVVGTYNSALSAGQRVSVTLASDGPAEISLTVAVDPQTVAGTELVCGGSPRSLDTTDLNATISPVEHGCTFDILLKKDIDAGGGHFHWRVRPLVPRAWSFHAVATSEMTRP